MLSRMHQSLAAAAVARLPSQGWGLRPADADMVQHLLKSRLTEIDCQAHVPAHVVPLISGTLMALKEYNGKTHFAGAKQDTGQCWL